MGQTSRLGAFLDPVADKLIVAVALVLLVSKEMPHIIVPGLEGMDGGHATLRAGIGQASSSCCVSIVIIGREIAISALREWMAEIGQRGKVKVSQLAKYKTILQIVGLSCMLFRWNLPILPGVRCRCSRSASCSPSSPRSLTLISADVLPARRLAGPARPRMTRSVCVFCGSAPGVRPSYSRAARELGVALAQPGITLVYGGGQASGSWASSPTPCCRPAGASSGVIPRMLIERELAHPNLTTPARGRPRCMSARRSWPTCPTASSGLPGGMGTFDELVEIVTWAQLGLHAKPVVLANIDNYFAPMYAMLDQRRAGGIRHRRKPGPLAQCRIRGIGNANPYERRGCRRGNSLTCRATALEFAPSPGSGNSSVGRARPCQGRGREFESRFPLQFRRYPPFGPVARWQNGYAAACKAVYAGSIPTLASIMSIPMPRWRNW